LAEDLACGVGRIACTQTGEETLLERSELSGVGAGGVELTVEHLYSQRAAGVIELGKRRLSREARMSYQRENEPSGEKGRAQHGSSFLG
jgi:hypothetical protein